jgi:hypothetical protein
MYNRLDLKIPIKVNINKNIGGESCKDIEFAIQIFKPSKGPPRTTISFHWLHYDYQFLIYRWHNRGRHFLFKKFFKKYPNDENKYGKGDDISDKTFSHEQEKNIILQMCSDVIDNLDKILQQHQICIQQYANWYRDEYYENLEDSEKTYDDEISYITCCGIIHQNFMNKKKFTVI